MNSLGKSTIYGSSVAWKHRSTGSRGGLPVGFPAQRLDTKVHSRTLANPLGNKSQKLQIPGYQFVIQPLSTPLVGSCAVDGASRLSKSTPLSGTLAGLGAPLAPASRSQNAAKSITQFEAKIQKFAVQGVGGVACGGIGVVLWLDLVRSRFRRRQNGPAEKIACGEGEHLAFRRWRTRGFGARRKSGPSLGFPIIPDITIPPPPIEDPLSLFGERRREEENVLSLW